MLTRNNWRFFQSWLEVARQHNTLPQCLRRRSSRAQSLSPFPQTEIVPQIRKLSTAVFSSSCVLQSPRLKSGRLRCDTVLASRLKTLLCRHDGQIYSTVGFRTSPPRQAIPPLLVLLFVKPIAKLTAILSGRTFRNWWRALPHNKRQYFYESLGRHKYKILATLLGLTGVCSVYYYSHLQTTPFTNRKRFIAFTDSQFKKIAASEYEKMKSLHAEKSVHSSHPLYLTIAKLVIKITEANSDIPEIRDRTWTIHIIDKDVKNAFVLPNGEIFVFAGILKAVTNEDQLGAVLAHEIAHVVLNHAAEQVSFTQFVDVLLIVVLAALWAFLPSDGLAVVATWFKSKVVELLLEMPYSRSLETEADRVGLILAAKSCFDVRECKAFWELMALRSDAGEEDTVDIEWLSTHPTHQNRADSLGAHMPEVLKLREECKCPPLPAVDPSAVVAKQRQILLEKQERRRKEPPSISGIRITS
ncbi:metalloendopeptidase OMA1, mitochondrial-like [Acanthaster planci]|uniref:Metalloendopeptidase OMA1, mitochondrial n=1 Tax=Acanthaster planci TaxID=133434 RepID=A0A8B7Y9P4_ACAPL|nr:metalloendopeptidase OMA1, mitochondrial-like [Acanthaster planci]